MFLQVIGVGVKPEDNVRAVLLMRRWQDSAASSDCILEQPVLWVKLLIALSKIRTEIPEITGTPP